MIFFLIQKCLFYLNLIKNIYVNFKSIYNSSNNNKILKIIEKIRYYNNNQFNIRTLKIFQ